MKHKGWVLLLFLGASLLASALGGFATASSVDSWFSTLVKPTWNPPSSIFAPVWTVLYVLMAISAWRIWLKSEIPGSRAVLAVYFVHLALNTLWSLLFFGLRNPAAGLVDIVLLWGLIVWLQIAFWKRDRLAGLLWVPYLIWVSFASALNFAIWRLN